MVNTAKIRLTAAKFGGLGLRSIYLSTW